MNNPDAYEPANLQLPKEVLTILQARRSGQSKKSARTPADNTEPSLLPFYVVYPGAAKAFANREATRADCAAILAIYEAWFRGGVGSQHPNPFPLAKVDFRKWNLSKYQKSHALKFWAQAKQIFVDRSHPNHPTVEVFWAPRRKRHKD